jgi:signal transduction histidine kinase
MEYSKEDERLLIAVASRMAVELENAALYNAEKTIRHQLEKENELKTEFLHSVAHELKTPLTAILSSSELLSEEASIDPHFRKRLSDNIRKSADRMDKRVSELLDLARMQIGELSITPTPLEIGPLITESALQLNILFTNKRQTLALEIPSSLPKVNADKGRLEQILSNLLSNANKFSPAGSKIVLRARKADGKVIIEVEDSAPAVTEEEKGKLFNPYYRGDDADKRQRFPGLGLGLAISRRLVELHQGEIWVETKPVEGNIFAFSLPALD